MRKKEKNVIYENTHFSESAKSSHYMKAKT